MALKHFDGFDQFQGRSGGALLSALASAGYTVSPGIALAEGRYPGTCAIEMRVSSGSAGQSWSMRSNSIKQSLKSVAHTGDRWVAVGDNGMIAVTQDTISYSIAVPGISTNLKAVAFGNGRLVAVGGPAILLAGSDGLSWTVKDAPRPSFDLADVAYADGKWVVVGSEAGQAAMLISIDDGLNWNIVNVGATAQPLTKIAYGGGSWMAGGRSGAVIRAADPTAWTLLAAGIGTPISGLAHGDGVWMVASGRMARISMDNGGQWVTAATDVLGTVSAITGLAYANGLWVVIGTQGEVRTSSSPAGLTWDVRQSRVSVTLNDVAVATGAQGGWMIVGDRTGQVNGTAQIVASMAPPTTVRRTFASTKNRVVFGFAYRATARGRILSIKDLADLDWPVGIEMAGQRGNAIPIRNFWYYYEITIDKAAETIRLHINNTADMTVPLPAAGLDMTEYVLTWQAENGAVARLDDIYFLDSDNANGETLLNRLGPIRVPVREVDADYANDWDGSSEGEHWPLVGMLPPTGTDCIVSSVSGAQDLFASATALPDGAGTQDMPILAVGVVALAKKSDLDNRHLGLVVGENGPNQKEVVDDTLSMNPEYSYAVFEKAPGNADWDVANIVATPFGVVVRP